MKRFSLYSMKMLPWLAASVCVALQASASSSFLPPQAVASAPHLVAQAAADLTTEPVSAGQPTSADELVIDDLTDDQAAQMELIFEEYQPQIEAAVVTYEAAAADLLDLLQPATPAADLIAARETVLEAERAAEDLIFERNLVLREVLTLNQRQSINTYLRNGLGL